MFKLIKRFVLEEQGQDFAEYALPKNIGAMWLRRKRQTPITGVPAPAAWRTILFVGLLWFAH